MPDCYNKSYEDHIKLTDFLENRLYLDNKTCCDPKDCDELALEYQNLLHKCHDVYGKTLQTNEKGKILTRSVCDNIEKQRDKYRKMSTPRRTTLRTRSSRNTRRSLKSVRSYSNRRSLKSIRSRRKSSKNTIKSAIFN